MKRFITHQENIYDRDPRVLEFYGCFSCTHFANIRHKSCVVTWWAALRKSIINFYLSTWWLKPYNSNEQFQSLFMELKIN